MEGLLADRVQQLLCLRRALESLENIWNDALSSRGGARIDGRLNSLLLVALCSIVEEKVSCFRTFAFKHQHDFARFCDGFGVSHSQASTRDEFDAAFAQAARRGLEAVPDRPAAATETD